MAKISSFLNILLKIYQFITKKKTLFLLSNSKKLKIQLYLFLKRTKTSYYFNLILNHSMITLNQSCLSSNFKKFINLLQFPVIIIPIIIPIIPINLLPIL